MASNPVLLNTTSTAALVAAEAAGASEETVETAESEFEKAFAQITAAEGAMSAAPGKTDGAASAVAAPSAPDNAQEGEAAREAAAVKKEETSTEAGDQLPKDDDEAKAKEAEAAAAETAKQSQQISDDEFVRRLAGLMNKPQPQQEVDQTRQQVQEPFRPVVSPEVAAAIKEYAEQFPEVMKGEQAIRTVEMQHFAHFLFSEIQKAYQPFIDQISIVAERVHLGDIQAKVPDYAVTRPEVEAWVKTQPDFIREGMERVIAAGTATQVTTLINMYKEANPKSGDQAAQTSQTTTQTPPKAPAAPAAPAVSAAARAAAAKLVAVPSKRTGAPQPVVPETFDDSFDYFSKIA